MFRLKNRDPLWSLVRQSFFKHNNRNITDNKSINCTWSKSKNLVSSDNVENKETRHLLGKKKTCKSHIW